jgi:hypothetical protein
MNINFAPFTEPRSRTHWVDFPTRMTDRYNRIFTSAIDNEVPLNYRTLIVLGGFALVTGVVGTVASYYFQSDEYLSECLGNIAVGVIVIGRGRVCLQNSID